MKKMKLVSLVLIAGFAISGISLQAHHSVKAGYDSSKVVTLTGLITKLDWTNPHAWITMDVKSDGQNIPWLVQLAAPGALSKAGLDKITFDFSQPISIEVWLAKNDPPGSHHANGQTLTMPDGRKFDVSDKWDMLAITVPAQK